jgi:hypothetical protein
LIFLTEVLQQGFSDIWDCKSLPAEGRPPRQARNRGWKSTPRDAGFPRSGGGPLCLSLVENLNLVPLLDEVFRLCPVKGRTSSSREHSPRTRCLRVSSLYLRIAPDFHFIFRNLVPRLRDGVAAEWGVKQPQNSTPYPLPYLIAPTKQGVWALNGGPSHPTLLFSAYSFEAT